MNTTTITATITANEIRVDVDGIAAAATAFVEPRPVNFAAADIALAAHGFGRTGGWDLGESGTIVATVAPIDNLFAGTRAARLDDAIGVTHDEILPARVSTLNDGDLITDEDQSVLYVIAGSRHECDTMRIHMVGEGQSWGDRFTTDFHANRVVFAARRKA